MKPIAMNSESSARHAQGAQKSMGVIALSFFVRFKWQYFPLLLSDYGRDIVRRKYDAIATDRAYENRPSGLLGPVGRWIDRMVLNFPLHEALRQRLRLVADSLRAQVLKKVQEGEPRVRVLSAPCGLIRDLLTCTAELRQQDMRVLERLELHALDLDASGEVLAIARSRAKAASVSIRFYQDDLFNSKNLSQALVGGNRFHIVNCIGLVPWLDLNEVERLARFFHDKLLAPDGVFIVDNWVWHKHSAVGKDLEIYTRYHKPSAFVSSLQRASFIIEQEKVTPNDICTVYVARAVPSHATKLSKAGQ